MPGIKTITLHLSAVPAYRKTVVIYLCAVRITRVAKEAVILYFPFNWQWLVWEAVRMSHTTHLVAILFKDEGKCVVLTRLQRLCRS